jgi:hypothetical protein
VANGPRHSNKVGSMAHRQSCPVWINSYTMGQAWPLMGRFSGFIGMTTG